MVIQKRWLLIIILFLSFEVKQFLDEFGIELKTRSPHYAQGNPLGEVAVGIIKRILRKTKSSKEFNIALLEYRNTPVKDLEYSPSQLLNSRLMRTKIPVSEKLLIPKLAKNLEKQFKRKKYNVAKNYNKNVKFRQNFVIGQKIRIKNITSNIWLPGEIVNFCNSPRSYIVKDANDNVYRRNSRFLRKNLCSPLKPNNENNKITKNTKLRNGKVY